MLKEESDVQSATTDRSYYIDSARKLDNLVQKAQRILPSHVIKIKSERYLVDPEALPYANEQEHLTAAAA